MWVQQNTLRCSIRGKSPSNTKMNTFFFAIRFQGVASRFGGTHLWSKHPGGMVAGSSKVRAHILNWKQEGEKENWEWLKVLTLQILSPLFLYAPILRLARPPLLRLPKQRCQLGTQYSNIWAYLEHPPFNQHTKHHLGVQKAKMKSV